jgi:hypothetical protein
MKLSFFENEMFWNKVSEIDGFNSIFFQSNTLSLILMKKKRSENSERFFVESKCGLVS